MKLDLIRIKNDAVARGRDYRAPNPKEILELVRLAESTPELFEALRLAKSALISLYADMGLSKESWVHPDRIFPVIDAAIGKSRQE